MTRVRPSEMLSFERLVMLSPKHFIISAGIEQMQLSGELEEIVAKCGLTDWREDFENEIEKYHKLIVCNPIQWRYMEGPCLTDQTKTSTNS